MVSSIHYFIQFFNHNAIIGKTGILEYVLMTPSHHRVHHGKNDVYINKNHGGTFIFWGKMFGTFQPEREDIEIKFGTTDNVNPNNPFCANMLPILSFLKIKPRNIEEKRVLNIPLKDGYLIVEAFFLFLLFLTYINYENSWPFERLFALILIVFAGTIALGSISKNERLGLISSIVISVPLLITYILYFQIFEIALTSIAGAMMLHSLFGTYKILNQTVD